MADDLASKDKALEALDFIIDVLKEHEQHLDNSINVLATVTRQKGDTKALKVKIEKLEEEINGLQKQLTNLSENLLNTPEKTYPITKKEQEPRAINIVFPGAVKGGSFAILECKQWEDFETLAVQAQILSFSYKTEQKVFQVDALKDNQLVRYIGALPKFSSILKTWLSQKFGLSERCILEGTMTIG
jgi:seryl-tRNA synthetase